uniref:Protein kinase domain-containing protein n=1 Tax=Kalanchoe fedtschenkoi TaxID=63787 RepID=A0A7N0TF98_KALFE
MTSQLMRLQSFTGRKLWGLSKFTSDCASGQQGSNWGTLSDQKDDITCMCVHMMRQMRGVYDPSKIKVKMKIVCAFNYGAVAAEARTVGSQWVILDKQLKHERKCCMEELQCNIVIMKQSQPKVLRLNLVAPPSIDIGAAMNLESKSKPMVESLWSTFNMAEILRGPPVSPTSSPDHGTPLSVTDAGTSSFSSSDLGSSPLVIPTMHGSMKLPYSSYMRDTKWNPNESDYDTDSENLSVHSQCATYFQPWFDDKSSCSERSMLLAERPLSHTNGGLISISEALSEKLSRIDQVSRFEVQGYDNLNLQLTRNLREVSLSRNLPSAPPPLCKICQHTGPVFGKPPRLFTYAELEAATDRFSSTNFLAEGGFGSVYRGILQDGQVVAVKQHKLASSQGDREFCSEVEVLSCAQHRNVVMLIGFCVEDGKRLLVYEYICNRSLDYHLYGRNQATLGWGSRHKIAVGTARGLRYLHEECRVGCIVHRDLRPNNILLTHVFEPLVGDFGLARWQPEGDIGVETRVLGTFGYLAPEYAQCGQITEKADVFSFGVVLVELVTGRKAIDVNRPRGQQCLTEWARPLLERGAIEELVDTRLESDYVEAEVLNMILCASMCIQRDPDMRPRMSQVLRMLEDENVTNLHRAASYPRYKSGGVAPRMFGARQLQLE